MKRTLKYISELIAAFVAVFVVMSGVFAWHLSQKPLQASYLTPYVQQGLHYLLPDLSPEIGGTLLVWDNKESSVALQSDHVRLLDRQQNLIAEFPSIHVRFSALSLLRGRFIPVELTISQPHLKFDHKEDGSFLFGGLATDSGSTATSSSSSSSSSLSDVKGSLAQLLLYLVRDGALDRIKLEQASVNIHEQTTNQDWRADVPLVSLEHDAKGLLGFAQLSLAQGENPAQFEAHYRFTAAAKTHDISLKFVQVNPSLIQGFAPSFWNGNRIDLPFTGSVEGTFDEALDLVKASAHVETGAGHLTVPSFWDEVRGIKKINLNVAFDKAQQKLQMTDSFIDFGDAKLALKVDGTAPTDPQKFDQSFVANVLLTNLSMDHFTSVWPKIAVPGARDWISASMSQGVFTRGDVTIRGSFKWNDLENLILESGEGTVSAKNGRVRYIDGVPPVEGVNAEAKFDLDHMDVALSGGGIGGLKLLPSTIQLFDFQKTVQNIIIPLKMAGPVRDVLRVIDAPPLGYAKAIGLKADEIDGRMEGLLDIRLPLLKEIALKDVAIKADAKLIDFTARKLIPGVEITEGGLALSLDQDGFTIKGPAALNKLQTQISWEGLFAPSDGKPRYQATITGIIGADQWTALGMTAISKNRGSTSFSVHYAQPTAKLTQLTGDVNFKQAGFRVDQLNWTKELGAPANLTFAVDIAQGKPIQIKAIDLQGGPSLKVKGAATLDPSGRLLLLDIKPLIVGRTNASIRISQGSDDLTPMHIVAEGDALDMAGGDESAKEKKEAEPKEKSKEEARAKDYSLKIGKLYTSTDGYLGNVSGMASSDKLGWISIELHAMAQGEHPLDVSLAQQLGDAQKRVLSITCDDFGQMLKGLGLTDAIHGGSVAITGQSAADDPRLIEGEIKIGSFSASGLPVLVRLFSAASLFGVTDLVTGKTSFDRLSGGFKWHKDIIDFQGINLIGNVFGVNINGPLNLDSGKANLHGTLVPFSLVNRVLNAIPVVGGLITGGDGEGVVGVNYSVKGPLGDPSVSVNPASLFTPGFLRDLFFRNEPQPEDLKE